MADFIDTFRCKIDHLFSKPYICMYKYEKVLVYVHYSLFYVN